MKKSSLFLLLLVLTLLLSACNTSSTSKAKNITLADLNTALESNDVDLKTVDDGKNITQFTITASNVNADKLVDRNYVKQAYVLMMTKPGDMVYGQFMVMTGFGVMMDVFGLIDTTPKGEFDTEAFVNELLDVICDGKAHSEAGWTITAKVDKENDTITITGVRQ